jgi:hypothetical protein
MSFSEEEIEWEDSSSSGDDNQFLVLSSKRTKAKSNVKESDSQKKRSRKEANDVAAPAKDAKQSRDASDVLRSDWKREVERAEENADSRVLQTVKLEDDEDGAFSGEEALSRARKRNRKRSQHATNSTNSANSEDGRLEKKRERKERKEKKAPREPSPSPDATAQAALCPVGSVQSCRLVDVDLSKGLHLALLDDDGQERTVPLDAHAHPHEKPKKKKERRSALLTAFASLCDIADDLDENPIAGTRRE